MSNDSSLPQGSGSLPTVKKGHPNPERLDQTVEIYDAPSKIFVGASIATSIALGIWAFSANIPSTMPAKAVFIEPYTVYTLNSTGNGRYFFKDDISPATSNQISAFVALVTSQLNRMISEPSLELSSSTITFITSSINSFFQISTKAEADAKSLNVNSRGYSKNYPSLPAGGVVGYILNEQTALNFASQLATFSQKDRYSSLSINSYRSLLSQGNRLEAALAQRVRTMNELSAQGIVAKSSVLQSRQQELQQNQSNISQLLSLQSSKSGKSESLTELLGTIVASTRGIQMITSQNITLLSKLIRSGTVVTANQPIAIGTTGAKRPYTILCFIPGTSYSGVKRGAKVLVSPVNVDQNTYGSIVGEIQQISPVAIGPDNATALIGSSALTNSVFTGQQNLFVATIALRSADSPSGYKWTSSNGPSFEIPLTTIANVQVVTHTYKPYQIVLPFLRSATGS